MKRILNGAFVALSLALTGSSVHADCSFEYSCSRHFCYTRTSKNRCFSFNSGCNPLPCAGGCPSGPAMWNALPAYGYAAPAPVVAAPAATAPTSSSPSFKAPAPAPATNGATGLQQAGYFYYGPSNSTGYNNNAGYNYNYGASYGYSYYGYAQAPNYWY
jgi:hypothetical protein